MNVYLLRDRQGEAKKYVSVAGSMEEGEGERVNQLDDTSEATQNLDNIHACV